jgi:hypothetical protein
VVRSDDQTGESDRGRLEADAGGAAFKPDGDEAATDSELKEGMVVTPNPNAKRWENNDVK